MKIRYFYRWLLADDIDNIIAFGEDDEGDMRETVDVFEPGVWPYQFILVYRLREMVRDSDDEVCWRG
jgi:hypothetical protein